MASAQVLVTPPVALTLHVVARILTEIGRTKDEDLEALRPALVAPPRTGGTRTTSHSLTSTISSSSFIRPLPRTTTYTSSCSLCVWPYGKR